VEKDVDCNDYYLPATINFEQGVECGKRDSRVFYNAIKSEAEGGFVRESNPGEWPWLVLIFRSNGSESDEDFVGAGTLMHDNVVITTATKGRQLQENPSVLIVRLGDWDRKNHGPNFRESHRHKDRRVNCIILHPRFNPRSLAYNVAVIKLGEDITPVSNEVSNEFTNEDRSIPRSYINTACLPESRVQFSAGRRCWVAAWGNGERTQREIDIPMVGRAECEEILRPEFVRRGVRSWAGLSPSEVCAGGERGKDTCRGEAGTALVCLDQVKDQFYAVGMTNYGFGCGEEGLPAVYVYLADPEVKSFITDAFDSPTC